MNINKKLMNLNHTAKKRNKNNIQWIVCHYVGALGDAKANAEYYGSTYVGASADFFVGFSGDIWQANDYYNYYSWHCGGGLQGTGGAKYFGQCTNANSIGIEMCVRKKSTKTMNATDKDWYFENATIESTAKLVAHLMKELDIDIDHVIRHYDVTGKICPNPMVYDNGEITWKQFKEKVKKYYNGDSSSTITTTSEPVYRVRKSWADEDSQIFAGTLEGAKKACKTGYSVYDEKGKEVYSNKPKDNVTITSNQDKIWMGWTKRETNKEGLRGIHGDSGKAYGLQFDYRYGLLDFLQYCINYNPSRYADFKKFIDMGKGNSKLVYNKELGKLWQKYYDAYTEEFEQLQYTCAYINYYEPVKKYIKSYGIDLDNHSPALKGTAWSMSFRSGQKSAADKFSSCKDSMSDDKIMQIVYSSYGTADSNRWTKAGQWGDALDALNSNSYSIVNKSMTSNNTSVPSQPQSLTPYRVGTAWKNGKCQNQIGAYDVISNAKSKADDQAKSKKKTYKVFDASGNVVYTAKYTSTVSKFEPYNVKVKVPNLRIRKTPNGEIVTQNGKEVYTGIGVFGIVEEKKAGSYTWGKLKSGMGWIALDAEYVEKI